MRQAEIASLISLSEEEVRKKSEFSLRRIMISSVFDYENDLLL